ncbi:MAG: hypothetical protein AAFN77_03985 [Planctomycetota bacterium]
MSLLRLLPRFQRAEKAAQELAARESLDRSAIQDWQLNAINQMWRSATQNVPHYQQLHQDQSLPTEFDSLDQYSSLISVLDKSYVRNHPERFHNSSAGPGRWLRSGGSTGTPMRIFWTHEAHLINLQTRYRWYHQWGFDAHDRQTFLWGHAGSFAPGLKGLFQKFKQPILDRLRSRQRLSAYRLSPADLDQYIRKTQSFKPSSIYGYASAVELLAKRCQETGETLRGLKAVLLTGEPAYAKSIAEIESILGCPAIREYGSVETGIMANDHRDKTLRIREDRFFIESIPFTDDTYQIVVTNLINTGFPLFRYPIGDLCPAPLDRPAKGFAILQQVLGRDNDFVVGKTGRLVHANGVKHVFEQVDAIRRFRVNQDETGFVTAQLESHADSITSYELAGMQSALEELLEGFEVKIEIVDALSGNRAGKHRWVTSAMRPDLTNQTCT